MGEREKQKWHETSDTNIQHININSNGHIYNKMRRELRFELTGNSFLIGLRLSERRVSEREREEILAQ